MTNWRQRFLGVALLALSVSAFERGSAQAQPSGWQLSLQVHTQPPDQGSWFDDVASVSATSAWAIGQTDVPDGTTRILVEHWDGTSWHAATAPQSTAAIELFSVSTVVAQSDTDVWISGYSSAGPFVTHWDGHSWTLHVLSVIGDPVHIAAFAPDDFWALGGTQAEPGYEHWDGRSWTSGPLPAAPVTFAEQDSGSPAWSAAVAVNSNKGRLLHYNGTAWVLASAPRLKRVDFPAGVSRYYFSEVLQVAPTDVWLTVQFVSRSAQPANYLGLWHSDGKVWTHVLDTPNNYDNGILSDGASGVWLLDGYYASHQQRLLHVTGGQVVATVDPPTVDGTQFRILSITGPLAGGAYFAVGDIYYDTGEDALIERFQP